MLAGSNRSGFKISLSASLAFLIYVGCIFALALRGRWRRQRTARKNLSPSSDESMGEVESSYKLLRTQFGFLCVNLIFSDLVQALGFALDLIWLSKGTSPSPETHDMACTTQGVFIAAGDTASALWAISLAVHTLCLIMRWTVKRRWLLVVFFFNWTLVAVLGLMGPLVVERYPEKGPFYAFTVGLSYDCKSLLIN